MKDIELKSKVLKLTTSKRLWKTDETITNNPYLKQRKGSKKINVMRFRTYSFSLPVDTVSIEAISVNNNLVWACNGKQGVRSAILGGGGRFIHTRSLYDRCVVAQNLLLKDIPYFSEKEPDFKIVISHVDQESLLAVLRKNSLIVTGEEK